MSFAKTSGAAPPTASHLRPSRVFGGIWADANWRYRRSSDGGGLNWLYSNTEVLARRDGADGSLEVTVRVPPERADGLRRRFASS